MMISTHVFRICLLAVTIVNLAFSAAGADMAVAVGRSHALLKAQFM